MNEPSAEFGLSRPERIFEVFADNEVDYVVIGGVAVIAHGHTRNTRDVDFIAHSERSNLKRLAASLQELRAELRGVDAHLPGVDLYDPETLGAGGNLTMTTVAGALDFFNEVPGGAPYAQVRARALRIELDHVPILIAGIDDLIRMKAVTDRPRDRMDIAALRDITRHRRRR